MFSNAVRPQKSCKKRDRAAEETGYSEANSRSFRQFHRFHGAENDFHIAGGGVRSSARIAAPASGRGYDESPLDARMLDLDDEGESPFLRGQKRVPVRRGALPRKATDRIKLLLIVLLVVGAGGAGRRHAVSLRHAVVALPHRFQRQHRAPRQQNVTRWQVLEVMGGDIDRNIFFVPLAERKKQLEEIPWVESAAVMRLYPNRLRIELQRAHAGGFCRRSIRTSRSSTPTASSWICRRARRPAIRSP